MSTIWLQSRLVDAAHGRDGLDAVVGRCSADGVAPGGANAEGTDQVWIDSVVDTEGRHRGLDIFDPVTGVFQEQSHEEGS